MELVVWMNGRRVGTWGHTRSGRDTFQYDPDWVSSPYARNLSLSLPITSGDSRLSGSEVGNYFDNLLPDHPRLRERLRQRYGLRSTAAFELLSAIGRECVGAVQLLPKDIRPAGWNEIKSEPWSDEQVAQHLRQVPLVGPFAAAGTRGPDELRISIAGVQEKTALLRIGDRWHLPLDATPTTHILKLPMGAAGLPFDINDSVENEWLCSEILRELGLPVARTEIATFGEQKVLLVERFDRRWQGIDSNPYSPGFTPPAGTWIARLPQEDFCQATGGPPDRKYESNGGPGIRHLLEILARSEQATRDQFNFALAQLAFWLLAAIDGHAKNFSIHHHRHGFSLTPLYDVLSAWPFIGHGPRKLPLQDVKLAMALRGRRPHYLLREIQPRHFAQLAESLGNPEAWPAMQALTGSVPAVLQRVGTRLPREFPMEIWDAISLGMRRQGERFVAEHGERHDDY
jgi:serine/threonine-protein kinase HipA